MTRYIRILLAAFVGLLAGPALAASRATLTIDNQRNDRVEIVVDRAPLGDVRGNSTHSFRLKSGRHQIQIRDRSGRLIKEASLHLTENRTRRISISAATGRLLIENTTDADMDVRIDRRSVGVLVSGAKRSFHLAEGTHRVEATYEVLGREMELIDRDVNLREDARREIQLRTPDRGLVRVENRTGRAGTLYVDGERQQMLDPGQVALLELSLGPARISLKVRQRTVDSTRVEVRPFRPAHFEPELQTGELRVSNPLPISVYVEVDGGKSEVIGAYRSRVFDDLLEGSVTVRIEDGRGLEIDRLSMDIRAGSRRTIEVPEPTVSLLEIQSDHHTRSDVFIDSKRVGVLAAHDELRLAVEPGTHRVQVRDPNGRVLLDRRVQVGLYDTLALHTSSGTVAHSHDSSEHIRPGEVPSGQVFVVD